MLFSHIFMEWYKFPLVVFLCRSEIQKKSSCYGSLNFLHQTIDLFECDTQCVDKFLMGIKVQIALVKIMLNYYCGIENLVILFIKLHKLYDLRVSFYYYFFNNWSVAVKCKKKIYILKCKNFLA